MNSEQHDQRSFYRDLRQRAIEHLMRARSLSFTVAAQHYDLEAEREDELRAHDAYRRKEQDAASARIDAAEAKFGGDR